MKFPYKIATQEKEKALSHWQEQFVNNERNVHEGIWRRTQDVKNAKYSGWKSDTDRRLRVVHFLDKYNIDEQESTCDLVLEGSYLKINHSIPHEEAVRLFTRYKNLILQEKINSTEQSPNTINIQIEDLKICLRFLESEDEKKYFPVYTPTDYSIIDIDIFGGSINVEEERKLRPWNILSKGFRIAQEKGNPKYINSVEDILKYSPFQLVLGCGPSTEVGIPPLSYLHHVYQTTDINSRNFVFGEKDTLFEEMLTNAAGFYDKATKIMSTSWLAEAKSRFYDWVETGNKTGQIVGPVITNNYDGLTSLLGLEELYVRKFDDQSLVPKFSFHPDAKSLLVIGVHADRRLIQQSAREQGLKVIFIDPEKYVDESGATFEYKLEAPQDDDLVYNISASDFGEEMIGQQ